MQDKKLRGLLREEETRQRNTLNLIASENIAPWDIREIGASVLTNKYTEGYPGKRFYGGCEVFDKIETLAQERACSLFGADWANVQPHSGANANNAVFQAVMEPGDRLLGMALEDGGHLSHGMSLNVSGTFYNAYSYGLRGTEVDMEEVEEKARSLRPRLIIAGWSAYTDTLDFKRFREIADSVGAVLLVDMSHFAGLVAGDAYPSPFPWADIVTSTTHKTLRGPRGGIILGTSSAWEKETARAVFPGQQGGALPQTVAAKAAAFLAASDRSWKGYARNMIENAQALAESLSRDRRVICAGKTHQVLLHLEGSSGAEAEKLLERNGIICNRNTVPGEIRSALDPSGLRFGTPAGTTRGLGPEEFREVGRLVSRALREEDVSRDVAEMLERFPIP